MEGPQNILADNLSRLHHLPMPTQITEVSKHVERAIISDDEGDEEAFLPDCKYSCNLDVDDDINAMLECYLGAQPIELSNLVELIRIDNKTLCHISDKLVQC
jgi:hypothetical protein